MVTAAVAVAVAVVLGAAGGRASPCLFVARVGLTARRVVLMDRLGRGAAGSRALLCAASLSRACDSGLYTTGQMSYMRASAGSRDVRDVTWHRSIMKTCAGLEVDASAAAQIDATRRANNALIHSLDTGDAEALDRALEEQAPRKGRGRGRRRA